MKATVKEFNGVLLVDLQAETVEDAAKLARIAINGTRDIEMSCYANQDGTFTGNVRVQKARRVTNKIGRGKGY